MHKHLKEAIESVKWPPGSDKFFLYPESGKKRGVGNGVAPIKKNFIKTLENYGWSIEEKIKMTHDKRWGKTDAAKKIGSKWFAVEWETGNVSSSHRSIEKIALGMLTGVLLGGILVVPTREMYQYLTDRVGNFKELKPYFPLWRSFQFGKGLLGIIAVEHDGLSYDSPRIPKRTDGRALL
ncbi:MAG: hypothetical protein PVF58_04530 [Candidatus Methanofastidiosia archaeon]